MALAKGMRAWWAMLCLGLHLLTPSLTHAADVRLMNVGVRGGFTGQKVFGDEEIESFQQYDITATLGLPWSWYSESGWGVGTRLLVSAGALTGAGDTGFVGTLVPLIAIGPKDSQFSLDLGAGGALLSRYEFGNQDFGGPFQVVLTFGLRVPVYRGIVMGYRVQHLSDATLYGSKTRGADLHMFELIYSLP
jgi:Lipid A 3-O-deacylase (PagL)